ncbi:hypothetical protein V6N13_021254 [Hibiscus sabdariffa]
MRGCSCRYGSQFYVHYGFHGSKHRLTLSKMRLLLGVPVSGSSLLPASQVFQLHRNAGFVLPLQLLQRRSPFIDDGPRRRHRHARLGPEIPFRIQAGFSPHPRLWRQRNVAMERLPFAPHLPLQRLCPGPPLLRRLLHDPTREIGAIPGPVRDPGHGDPWGC